MKNWGGESEEMGGKKDGKKEAKSLRLLFYAPSESRKCFKEILNN